MRPIDFPATLRPSMQDPPTPTQDVHTPSRRRARGTPRGQWTPDCDPSTPKSLLAITPPRPAGGHRACRERNPPYNSPSNWTQASSGGVSFEAKASALDDPDIQTLPLAAKREKLISTSRAHTGAGSSSVKSRSRSLSPWARSATSNARPREADNGALISLIHDLRTALRSANEKLDALEFERSSLKRQLAAVVNESGTHSAQMRMLEKQLYAVKRQEENSMASALSSAEQQTESYRKRLSHKDRELGLLRSELEERERQIQQLGLERNAALEEADQLRDDMGDLQHSMQALQESLRLMEERNANVAHEGTLLDTALQEEKSKSNRLLEELLLLKKPSSISLTGNLRAEEESILEEERQIVDHGHRDLLRISKWLPVEDLSENELNTAKVSPDESSPRFMDISTLENMAQRSEILLFKQNGGEVHPGHLHAQSIYSTSANCEIPDSTVVAGKEDFGEAGEWVRREVLEQVKIKAKADLVEQESELMTIILAMEAEQGGSGRLRISPVANSDTTPRAKARFVSDGTTATPRRYCSRAFKSPVATFFSMQVTAAGTSWSRSAAKLLNAGWQLAEYQERIELLEMDREVLSKERDELREQGARDARLETNARAQYLLDAGRAEISALQEQVNLLSDSLRTMIAQQNLPDVLNDFAVPATGDAEADVMSSYTSWRTVNDRAMPTGHEERMYSVLGVLPQAEAQNHVGHIHEREWHEFGREDGQNEAVDILESSPKSKTSTSTELTMSYQTLDVDDEYT